MTQFQLMDVFLLHNAELVLHVSACRRVANDGSNMGPAPDFTGTEAISKGKCEPPFRRASNVRPMPIGRITGWLRFVRTMPLVRVAERFRHQYLHVADRTLAQPCGSEVQSGPRCRVQGSHQEHPLEFSQTMLGVANRPLNCPRHDDVENSGMLPNGPSLDRSVYGRTLRHRTYLRYSRICQSSRNSLRGPRRMPLFYPPGL